MARRMFSQRITNSGKFLQMSTGAQALYFHLALAADDDGVVDAITVLRTTNAQEDDFRILVGKNLIRPLNEEMITFILDWKEHNLLRADRITPSLYRGLLVQVMPEVELLQPKKRADVVGYLKSGRPLDALSKDKISKDNTISPSDEVRVVLADEEGNEVSKPEKKVSYTATYNELCDWMENLTGVKMVDRRGQYKALKLAREAGISRDRLIERAEQMWDSGKYEREGMDWFTVVYSFNKKA